MCGRSACSCDCERIRQSCSYRRRRQTKTTSASSLASPPAPPPHYTTTKGFTDSGISDDGCGNGWSYEAELIKPVWVTINDQQYYPSYNISPQTNTPVLLSSQHSHIQSGCGLSEGEELTERVIQVMKWGLIPQWHRGDDPKSFPSLLNNCRYEGMFDKPSFRTAINRRQRCVVLCEGFYEWKREGKGKDKQPYFVYFTNPGFEDKSNRLLTLAGLYDIWTPEHSESSPLYTYTIITVEATKSFSAIHDRLPAVLENDCAIDTWLNISIPTSQAIKCIKGKGSEELSWHPVSSMVNNTKNKSPDCITKIDLESKKIKGTLYNWFKTTNTPTLSQTAASTTVTTTDDSNGLLPVSKKAKMC